MFVTRRDRGTIAAMTFAGAVVAATLAGSGLVAADTAKTVKVNYRNGSSVPIQVFLYDQVGKTTVVKYNEVTPGGSGSAQVTVKYDGNVDLTYTVYTKNDKGSWEKKRCRDVRTSAETASATTELVFDKLGSC